MVVRGATIDQIGQAAQDSGVEVVGSQGSRGTLPRREGRGFRFTLLPIGRRFQRRSHRGRRINAVCWHGHYAFMQALFDLAPDATLVTTMARYNGRDDFETNAWGTQGRNIGSIIYPLAYGDACDC